MMAIGNDEGAAASLGVPIVQYKTLLTGISAFITAIGGCIYAQYMMVLNPGVLAGVAVSLAIVFKAILGGMFSSWGPLIGSALIIGFEEFFRIMYGSALIGWSTASYGIVIIILVSFFPKGIYGTLREMIGRET